MMLILLVLGGLVWHDIHIEFFAITVANLTSLVWWLEIYLHILSGCAIFCKVASPALEWADSSDGAVWISSQRLLKIHSIYNLIAKFGALSTRPNMPNLRALEKPANG